MNREFLSDLAARGLRMPIGTDLVMHEESEPEKVRNGWPRAGQVIERAAPVGAHRLRSPLMDLRLDRPTCWRWLEFAELRRKPITYLAAG